MFDRLKAIPQLRNMDFRKLKQLIGSVKVLKREYVARNLIASKVKIQNKKVLVNNLVNNKHRGIVFFSDNDVFLILNEEYMDLLKSMRYQSITIGYTSGDVLAAELEMRLKETLEKEVIITKEKVSNRSIFLKPFQWNLKRLDTIKSVFEVTSTLTGLIENHLLFENLMIIIRNSDEINRYNKYEYDNLHKILISKIFDANGRIRGNNQKISYRQALTFAMENKDIVNENLRTGSWFNIDPSNEILKEEFIGSVFSILNHLKLNIFKDSILLTNLLKISRGSATILRMEWSNFLKYHYI